MLSSVEEDMKRATLYFTAYIYIHIFDNAYVYIFNFLRWIWRHIFSNIAFSFLSAYTYLIYLFLSYLISCSLL